MARRASKQIGTTDKPTAFAFSRSSDFMVFISNLISRDRRRDKLFPLSLQGVEKELTANSYVLDMVWNEMSLSYVRSSFFNLTLVSFKA